jgi:hypothetical protein
MKKLSLFLIALIILASTVPANAQRRRREAQKQTTQQEKPAPQKQSTSTDTDNDSGRRSKRSTAEPKVPCTLTLSEAPAIRGFALGGSLLETKARFGGTTVAITAVDPGPAMYQATKFEQRYVLYSNQQTMGSANTTLEEAARLFKNEEITKSLEKKQAGQRIEREAFKDVKEIQLSFYGGGFDPSIYFIEVIYLDDLWFNSTQQLKEVFSTNFKIPVDSWVPVDEDRKRVNDWKASCNGWSAYFRTSGENEGLNFAIWNTDVHRNMKQLEETYRRKHTTNKNAPIFTP